MEPGWLLVWFGGLTLVHLVVLAAILRGWSGGNERSTDVGQTEAGTCPECGTQNNPEYRYCRSCVSTLGPARLRGRGDLPDSRRVP